MSSSPNQHASPRSRLRRLLAGGLVLALGSGVVATAAAPAPAAAGVAASALAAGGTTYEAEDQVLTGLTQQTEHAGYTGTGYVGGFGVTGNALRASITSETGGPHDLVVRYAAGSGGRTLTLDVNGATRQVALPGTGAWSTYALVWVPVDLQAGANLVELRRGAADSGQLNVDHLRVAPQVGVRHEAEAAALSDGASTSTEHSGYTGAGYVGGYFNQGATTTFTVQAAETGNHPATLRYGAGPNPFNGPKKVTLVVNGVSQPVILPGFGSWKDWGDFALDLPLNAGANEVAVRYAPGDDGNVNLDHLDVGLPAPVECEPTIEPDDTFDGDELDRCRWTTVLNEDPTGYRVTGGALEIDARAGDLSGGIANARNVVLQPARVGATWMTETTVSIDGTDDYVQGGLVVWGNNANFGKIMVMRTPAGEWKVELGRVTANDLQYTGSAVLPAGAQGEVRLRLWVLDGTLRGSYSLDDGDTYTVVGDGYGTAGLADPLVGLAAFNGTGTETARFDGFAVGAPVRVDPTVAVQTASAPVLVGESSTVTVQVTAPGATPTGEVTLTDDGEVVGTATLTNGSATFEVGPYTGTGTRSLAAAYAGDSAVTGGTGTGSLTVTAAPEPAASTVAVTANPGSVQVGQTSTVTVAVSATGTTPTGEVTLSDGSQVVGTATLANGSASFTVGPFTAAGTRSLTAAYAGSATVAAGTGTGSLTVTAAPDPEPVASTVTVTANPGSVQVGQTSTVTVAVSATGTTPTGEVTLSDGSQVVGTATLANGSASFTVGPFTAAGTRSLTAAYAGSATVAAGTGTGSLTVSAAPEPVASTVAVTANPASVQVGQTSTVTVAVSATGATPAGQVTLRDGGQVVGTATLVNGSASFTVGPFTAAGTRSLTAAYAGSPTVAAGAGTGSLTVTPVPDPDPVASTVTVTATPGTVQVGQTSTVTVAVSATGTTPVGQVTLRDGGQVVGTATLVNGSASFTVGPFTAAGTRSLTAAYAGSATVAAGTGTGSLTVTAVPDPDPVASTVTVTATPGTVQVGQTSVVRVAVTAAGVTPTGAVTLSDGAGREWSGTLLDGAVTFRAGPWTTAGERTLTASYAGDVRVAAGDGTTRVVVRALPAASVRVPRKVVDATRNRRHGVVPITCTPAGVRCAGTVELRLDGRLLAAGRVSMAGGRSADVRIRLTPLARRLLADRPRVRATLVVALDGGSTRRVAVRLTR
ncbi:Ig-like domain repeat protein [Nocardioides dongxiaopingii]|uniref:Ig-like domain repeat protein n=1 Tax=Nocardioides dongxiaopingii TaxID=2576036 RepID=UPI0010C76908|nr:Ig-like domain repeat protein [Nocardioides dongxiaopingii]